MIYGIIVKVLSGFYYVKTADGIIECKARGRFRLDGTSPLVGDRVFCSIDSAGRGRIDKIEERKNFFIRPAVANVDSLVFVAANTNPVTDPFLIDRVSVIAENAGCELIICINKTDINSGDELYNIFTGAGFKVIRTSAETGEGIDELRAAIKGKICAFTGNSGVGKSSIMNKLLPGIELETAEVSEKLGRGRHTTRHVELFTLDENTFAADTPGFASFDIEMMDTIQKEDVQYNFIEFEPYLGKCRFNNCMHLKEPGCAVRAAVESGGISQSRYKSYVKLYELASQRKFWENKDSRSS
ncbi:MAG: ribosome small subunit-dependent GTPase A [Candidatus Limivicinus sp.]|jgi:ribosome biogenesis GTPase